MIRFTARVMWILIGLCFCPRQAAAFPVILKSPPLAILQSRRLVLTMPAGVSIQSRDDDGMWLTRSYAFKLSRPEVDVPLECTILFWSLERAQRLDFCNGKKFTVKPHIRAWFSRFGIKGFGPVPISDSDTIYNALCIEEPGQRVVIIECIAPTSANSKWAKIEREIFRNISIGE